MSKYSMEDKYNENEKYNIADLCMEISNKGEKEQHYIKNHHPAIISREDFERTQQILAERRRS